MPVQVRPEVHRDLAIHDVDEFMRSRSGWTPVGNSSGKSRTVRPGRFETPAAAWRPVAVAWFA
jgi:hypothetical protein